MPDDDDDDNLMQNVSFLGFFYKNEKKKFTLINIINSESLILLQQTRLGMTLKCTWWWGFNSRNLGL